jgi:type VI secretion system ImpJ/VasE family protein
MQVHWQEGLFLQPHHLQIMQRGLLEASRDARRLLNPYGYGVIEGEPSPDALANGWVKFDTLRVIMPQGQEVYFPDNARLDPLNIQSQLATGGAAPLDILLAVPEFEPKGRNAFGKSERADPRVKLLYIPEQALDVADENTGENKQPIPIRKINARLLLKGDNVSGMDVLPLVRVLRAASDSGERARMDPGFAPPCLVLKASTVLYNLVQGLVSALDTSREQFRLNLVPGNLGIEEKWLLTMRLTALNRFCGSLPSLVKCGSRSSPVRQGNVSPFTIYLQLRELLGQLLALAPEKVNELVCQPYSHEDPMPAFLELSKRIRDEIVPPDETPFLEEKFTGGNGMMRVALTGEHFQKGISYFLAIETQVSRMELSPFVTELKKFHFMPRSLERAALNGIRLTEDNSPPLALPKAGNRYYFAVAPGSEPARWNEIQQERAISLAWNNVNFPLDGSVFTLFMVLPPGAAPAPRRGAGSGL